MYFVKYGEKYIHDPRVGMILPVATLETEVNKSDIFSFEIPITHEVCSSIKERDRSNLVTVLSDEKIIFRGEVISVKQNFQLTKTVECRGELAYLNDSLVRPYSTYEGEANRTAPDTINGYFRYLIEEHNSQVDSTKQFVIKQNLGASISDDNYIYVADASYPTVGDTIKNKILNDIGGYLELEYLPDGTRSISLLDDFQKTNAQVIDFGVNLLDFVNDVDSAEIATFVVPLGPTVNDNSNISNGSFRENMNISSSVLPMFETNVEYDLQMLEEAQTELANLPADASEDQRKRAQELVDNCQLNYNLSLDIYNDAVTYTQDRGFGSGYYKYGDMIYSAEAVQRYGWIGMTVNYTDAYYVSDLIIYGINQLRSVVEPLTTIEIKAIDLSLIKPNYDIITVGQYIRVRSAPHNFDSYMLCSKVTYDLVKPDNNTFTLGTVYETLTGQSNKKIVELNKTINSAVEAANKINNEIKGSVTSISNLQTITSATSRNLAGVERQVTDMDQRVIAVEEISEQVVDTSDYVVAQGKSGIWTYRKWASGVSECWGESEHAWTSEGTSGGLYYRSYTDQLPEGVFIGYVRVTSSVVSTSYGIFNSSFFVNTASEVSYYVYSPTNDAKTIGVQIHVIGKWK